MISADRYEAARDLVFAGRKQQYAGLLAKTDRYHEQVGCRIDEMLQQMKEEGVPVSIIAKYGLQLYPVTEENDRQSDAVVTVAQQAPGTALTAGRSGISGPGCRGRESSGSGNHA